ncbi:hypothetical protein WA026_005789 [Henosepilachna vigintioctopunctata]|uniref:Fanconi anemia group I protein n=1 Tax=Henosepilachna vigintioctopunctata TaxID=420089 RepID=A0AAW1TXH1_9CUCU
MSSLEQQIFKFGQTKNFGDLTKLLSDTQEDEILALIKTRIASGSFVQIWNYILKGFSAVSKELEEKKLGIIKDTLKMLDCSEIPTSQVNDIVSYINSDLPNYSTCNLVQLSNFCLEFLQNNDRSNQFSWKELFPEVISILSDQEVVDVDGTEMSGTEYKKQLLNTLCMMQWSPGRAVTIASMFLDIKLTKDEHTQVVNKFGRYIEKLTPQEIPGFVYQLLKLCKDHNLKSIIIRLQTYFGLRIYETSSVISLASSESVDLDAIESASNQDLLEAESTVLYHIHSSAALNSNSVKEYLLYLKNIIKTPEFILHPFQLTVLLTISTIQQYEDKVFEILKSCISRYYNEQHKNEESMWFHDMVPKLSSIENIFGQVLSISLQDRDIVLQGLINFAFVVLSIKNRLPGIYTDPIVEKQWNLGMLIIIKVCRHKRHKAGIILQEVINNILTDQNVTQYIDCLYIMSRNLALILLENQSSVIEIMQDLVQIPGSTAAQLLNAIMPLTKISSTLRDHLILLLRKALYSSKTETRQMAVTGYIKLLTSLKISSASNLSQLSNSMSSFSSGHSLFTQISLNRSSQSSQNSFSNESLCLEIVGILKRCFMQKLPVREQLYEGLFEAVEHNPEIRIAVLDVLWIQISNYYVVEEEVLPPLDFSKISFIKDIDVIQQEPLGKLLHVIGLILKDCVNSDSNETVQKFRNILESICDRMINCELVHFELDDGTDLSDELPECKKKVNVLQECMRVYESLIGYKINSWNNDTPRNGTQIVSLFQSYIRLVHFSKNIGKSKKERKKKNDSDASVQSNSTAVKKDQKNVSAFKMPETVLDFRTVTRALILLHEPVVEWTSMQEANTVKSKKEIHRHFLQSAYHLITAAKGKKYTDSEEKKRSLQILIDIAEVLFNRCIKTLSNFIDFDCASAVLVVECFYAILNCVASTHKKNLLPFLQKTVDENENLISCLSKIVKTYQKLFEMDDELESEDPDIKKLSLIYINTLSLLCTFIPSESSSLSIEFYDWLKNYAKNKTVPNRTASTSFFTLLFSTQIKFKKGLKLFNGIVESIGHIIGTSREVQTQEDDGYKIINEATANNAYICLTNAVKIILDEVDWVISRLKSEYVILSHVDDANNFRRKENLFAKEKGVTCQLCFVVTILEDLASVTIQPGPLVEAIFKNMSQFYITLTNLTKYFNARSTKASPAFQAARFEKLVKNVGKELSPSVNHLILYLEEESKVQQSTQSNKKSLNLKSKILKDTRLIPKVVYGMEQFSSCIIQLSNKTKVDLSKHIGQGTTRDFRILLKELNTEEDENEVIPNDSDSESTQIEDETSINRATDDEDTQQYSPPPKKSRKS